MTLPVTDAELHAKLEADLKRTTEDDATLLEHVSRDEKSLLSFLADAEANGLRLPDAPSANELVAIIDALRARLIERDTVLQTEVESAAKQLEAAGVLLIDTTQQPQQPQQNRGTMPVTASSALSTLSCALATSIDSSGEPAWVDASEVAPPVLETLLDAGIIERHPESPLRVRRHSDLQLGHD
jgi:hypothetical protein